MAIVRLSAIFGAVVLLGTAAINARTPTPAQDITDYRNFRVASASMLPTLAPKERLVAEMNADTPLQIGEIILVQVGDMVYVERVAALAGDRIAMRDGVPHRNGVAADQQPVGQRPIRFAGQQAEATILVERLPGESGTHCILDLGSHPQDNTAVTIVPPDSVYLLGDNRDVSVDSRFGGQDFGVGIVARERIIGRPLAVTITGRNERIGRSLRPDAGPVTAEDCLATIPDAID
jgi:signal peptidase I